MKLSLISAATLGALSLAGCVSIAPLETKVHQFDQAVHATTTAEINFLESAQKIDEKSQFYHAAYQFATDQNASAPFDLSAKYVSRVLTPEEFKIRQNLLNTVALYADKMQAIGSGDQDKQLEANNENAAKKLLNFASLPELSSSEMTVAVATQTAVGEIARWALDHTRAKDLKSAASAVQAPLTIVVKTLESENILLCHQLAGNLGQVELDVRGMIALAHARPGGDPTASFLSVVVGEQVLTETHGLMVSVADTPEEMAKPINQLWAAVLEQNAAIASAGIDGLKNAAEDLYTRAKGANDFYQAIKQK